MWYNNELRRLIREPNYKMAYEVFSSLISKSSPDIILLKKLYGEKKAEVIKENILKYFSEDKKKKFTVRAHNLNAPQEIVNARKEMENNIYFQRIQSALLKKNDIPAKPDLQFFYGEFAEYVYSIIRIYKKLNLKRKCELNAATHLNRVGAVVFQLKMNDSESFKYSSIAMMHDAVEDLLDYSELSRGGKIHIDYYNKFLDEFIPFELRKSVKKLTNHFSFLINFITEKLKADDKSVSLKNILAVLEKMQRVKLGELNEYIEKMQNLLLNVKLEGDIIESAKWECYKNLYLNGIAEASIALNDYRLYEIKGIDLSDNAHGKGALSSEAKIRNIRKNMLWGKIGYRLHSSWRPLNDKIQEIMEDALQSAEYLILSDLLQTQSSQDFVMSALFKIKKLEKVFYI